MVLTETHLFWDWFYNTESRCKHLATFVKNLIPQFSGCDWSKNNMSIWNLKAEAGTLPETSLTLY